MAAEHVAIELSGIDGASVTVVDHMASAGRKFLIAGRGGLNLTHTEPIEQFLDRYGAARHSLEPAIDSFGPDDLREWSESLGEPTFVGTSDRVFPKSFRATTLLAAWLLRLEALGVTFEFGSKWTGWDGDDLVFSDESGHNTTRRADATVLALGGASWSRTGSTAEWVPVVESAGVQVTPLRPSNCGFLVEWSDYFTERFAGQPLKNIALSFGEHAVRGEAMITDDGIEGNAIYALSSRLRDAIASAEGIQTADAVEPAATIQTADAVGTTETAGGAPQTEVKVDLRPDLTVEDLTERLSTRRPKESLSKVLRRAAGLPQIAVALLREGSHELPTAPAELAELIKSCPVQLSAAAPIDRAISTAGGVAFSEVNSDFMLRSRPGCFVAGEMLDWEAPTGGYLLQATFSTAVAAADGAVAWIRTHSATPSGSEEI